MICSRKSVSLALAVAAMVFSVTVTSKAENKRQLVTSKIDDKVTVRLSGNTRPEVNARNDRGAVDKEMPMEHLQLMLQRPAELEAAAAKFVDDLHDSKSPLFHKWVGAAEWGEKFGPSDSDFQAVKGWLASQGFTVNVEYPNKMFIDFSGSAAQVETAFHTEIHNYEVNGKMYIANSRDPQVPAALASAVRGVLYLNNFKPKAMHESVHQAHIDHKSGSVLPQYDHAGAKNPQYTLPPNAEGVIDYAIVPYDLEKIYNIAPLYSAGISGQGMKVVVVEDTNQWNCNGTNGAAGNTPGTACNTTTSDFAIFRNAFGLGRYPSGNLSQENPAPQTGTNNCSTPSTEAGAPTGVNSDDVEATIDVQWATAAAPSASIVSAACSDPRGGFGGLTAIENILTHPNADNVDVISMSYGESEESTGATLNAAFNTTFQQAAAAGIGIFVSSGDEDAASTDGGGEDCTGFPAADNGDFGCATHGITISGWMSSQYDVSVGGLDFADEATHQTESNYWLPTNNVFYGSAKSYIPEQPWNDSCASTLLSAYVTGSPIAYGPTGFCNTTEGENFLLAVGGSGGPSACATGKASVSGVASGTCVGYAKPTYQSSYLSTMPGLHNDSVRDTPDVALMAANGVWGHYYVICFSDTTVDGTEQGGTPCSDPVVDWPGYGGTSVSSPIFAAIQSLVVQKQGSLQGNPDTEYYALANAEYSNPTTLASCNSTNGSTSGSSCIFHDVTLGDNIADCQKDGSTAYDCYLDGANVGVLSTSDTAYQPAYLTTPGWDFGSGIGSVNAYNLVMQYNVAPTPAVVKQ
jgi:subtilase family serine protease